MKRFIIFIISFVFLFSITVPCFASDTENGSDGFSNDWTEDEKLEYYKYKGQKILHEITGIGRDNIAEDFLDRLYPFWDTRGYSSLEEYLLHELGYDEEREIFVPSQNLTVDINNCIQEYNDSVTMVYRYPIQSQNVSAETFPNKTVFDIFQKILLNYNDCYCFVIGNNNSQVSNINCRGWPVTDLNGSEFNLPYDTSSDGALRINVIPAPFAGVSQYIDLYSASTTFYCDDWISTFYPKSFWVLPDGRVFTYSNKQILGYGSSYLQVNPDNLPELDSLDTQYYWSWYGTSYATFLDNKHGSSFSAGACYSASPNALNVYKSEADMKKDIGSQFIGSYTPNYTGTCAPSVNVDVINNFEIPDSGGGSGSGSGSDDNGGGSSGGVFDDIISGIASGVGSIIKGIFSIIKDLVDAIADAIVSITKSITDLSSLLKTDFTDFLSAVFPFLPQEFITIMIAGVTLCLLGVVIKIFRG